jgi:hypothetical protein
MFRKLALSIGCLALVSSLSGLAHADSITFSFFSSPTPNSVTATAAGLVVTTNGFMVVSTIGGVGPILDPGTLNIFTTGPAVAGTFTNANLNSAGGVVFTNGPVNVIDVEVSSAALCGGICVTGQQHEGDLVAPSNTNGAFQGTFQVNPASVSPSLLAFLGFAPGDTVQLSGSDSLTTSNDSFNNVTKKLSAKFAGGDVTISIEPPPVPEPESLLLFGSGLLGMAGMIRRKLLAAR